MTFTYTQPAGTPPVFANPVHHVRFLLRDTAQSSASLSDEELAFELARWSADNGGSTDVDFYAVASGVADAMADSFAASGNTSKAVGNVSLSRTYSGEVTRLRELARRLARKSRTGTGYVMQGMGLAVPAAAQPPAQFQLGAMDDGAGGAPRPQQGGGFFVS